MVLYKRQPILTLIGFFQADTDFIQEILIALTHCSRPIVCTNRGTAANKLLSQNLRINSRRKRLP